MKNHVEILEFKKQNNKTQLLKLRIQVRILYQVKIYLRNEDQESLRSLDVATLSQEEVKSKQIERPTVLGSIREERIKNKLWSPRLERQVSTDLHSFPEQRLTSGNCCRNQPVLGRKT